VVLLSNMWQRSSFIFRLLVTASVALVAAAAAMLFFSARLEVREQRADMVVALAEDVDTLAAVLGETVVVGDFATIQRTLDRNTAQPNVIAATYRSSDGIELTSRGEPPETDAPGWFNALFGIADISSGAQVSVGGRTYGELTLKLSERNLGNRTWRHLEGHLAILLLAIVLDFIGIWLVLRSGLAPLRHLEANANAIAEGNFDLPLVPEGAPEVRHLTASFERMTKNVLAAQERVRQMAFCDQLTGLPNRRLLEDRLNQLIVQAQRDKGHMALLYLDLDNFKPINDERGHEVGDWLLCAVAKRIQDCVRKSDTVARIGGDEFVVLLPEAGESGVAQMIADNIRIALNAPFIVPDGIKLTVTSSIGIVLYPEHADNMQDLLRHGDMAMYRAKHAGRNTVAVYSGNADQVASRDD
jgi:diguanylate cyclase (GGDEF)-like protein